MYSYTIYASGGGRHGRGSGAGGGGGGRERVAGRCDARSGGEAVAGATSDRGGGVLGLQPGGGPVQRGGLVRRSRRWHGRVDACRGGGRGARPSRRCGEVGVVGGGGGHGRAHGGDRSGGAGE